MFNAWDQPHARSLTWFENDGSSRFTIRASAPTHLITMDHADMGKHPDQRLSRIEALETYTLSNAYAAFEEDIKGSITPGKLADITVLSKDILTIPEEEIPSAEVLYTIVGGEVGYRRP